MCFVYVKKIKHHEFGSTVLAQWVQDEFKVFEWGSKLMYLTLQEASQKSYSLVVVLRHKSVINTNMSAHCCSCINEQCQCS